MNKYDIYNKAIKVIESVETENQSYLATTYIALAKKVIKDEDLSKRLSDKLVEKIFSFFASLSPKYT